MSHSRVQQVFRIWFVSKEINLTHIPAAYVLSARRNLDNFYTEDTMRLHAQRFFADNHVRAVIHILNEQIDEDSRAEFVEVAVQIFEAMQSAKQAPDSLLMQYDNEMSDAFLHRIRLVD